MGKAVKVTKKTIYIKYFKRQNLAILPFRCFDFPAIIEV